MFNDGFLWSPEYQFWDKDLLDNHYANNSVSENPKLLEYIETLEDFNIHPMNYLDKDDMNAGVHNRSSAGNQAVDVTHHAVQNNVNVQFVVSGVESAKTTKRENRPLLCLAIKLAKEKKCGLLSAGLGRYLRHPEMNPRNKEKKNLQPTRQMWKDLRKQVGWDVPFYVMLDMNCTNDQEKSFLHELEKKNKLRSIGGRPAKGKDALTVIKEMGVTINWNAPLRQIALDIYVKTKLHVNHTSVGLWKRKGLIPL